MRYYTFIRPCGHSTRGSNKAKSLARPCNDCLLVLLAGLDRRDPLPVGFGLWSSALVMQWLSQHQKKGR